MCPGAFSPKAPVYASAPSKTDADVARAAEDAAQKLGLSSNGFGRNFTSYGTAGSGQQNTPIQRVTLGM